jgi:predicted RNA-binding Zn ribbon-like protein
MASPPELLVTLANLEVVRKPGRGPRSKPDPLATTASAAPALGVTRVSESDLVHLRALHEIVVELATALVDRRPPDRQAARLIELAAPSEARADLEVSDSGELRERLQWSDPTLVSGLARRVVHELGALDRARLRRCARPECDLVFYDTTKSNTRRWHAESPCGQRERQHRFREARGPTPGA